MAWINVQPLETQQQPHVIAARAGLPVNMGKKTREIPVAINALPSENKVMARIILGFSGKIGRWEAFSTAMGKPLKQSSPVKGNSVFTQKGIF